MNRGESKAKGGCRKGASYALGSTFGAKHLITCTVFSLRTKQKYAHGSGELLSAPTTFHTITAAQNQPAVVGHEI